MSSELVDTTEMYLRTFYELLEEGVELRRARIVERLHQSGPTVSQTVARMERDGLVVVESDRSISLTQEGHDVAQTVMRKHRLAECLLTQIIGLRPDLVHDLSHNPILADHVVYNGGVHAVIVWQDEGNPVRRHR